MSACVRVCLTFFIAAIYLRFPNFRHNDLKVVVDFFTLSLSFTIQDDNIFLHKSSNIGYTRYIVHGRSFYLPNIGFTALISDFDFACMCGYTFDNYKALEIEWDLPSANINGRVNQSADLYSLVTYLRRICHDNLPKHVNAELNAIFGRHKVGNSNKLLPGQQCPTVNEFLLNYGFFDEYLEVQDAVEDTWNASANNTPVVEFPICDLQKEARHCPVIRKTVGHTTKLPSQLYYESCPPIDRAVDSEDSLVYNYKTGTRLLYLIGIVYDDNYKFSKERRAECMELVSDTASHFLMTHCVPYRWWHAAFTCAFIDVIYEMSLAQPKQRYMDITQWGTFWEKRGEVRYTDMEILHFLIQWTWLRT